MHFISKENRHFPEIPLFLFDQKFPRLPASYGIYNLYIFIFENGI